MGETIELLFADAAGEKRPAAWQDKAGIVHRAVGAVIHRGIRLMWTMCEKRDIPANAAWVMEPGDRITCAECNSAQRAQAGKD